MEINLYDVLRLDSIYHFLSWKERINAHLVIQEKETELHPILKKIGAWLAFNAYKMPQMKFDENKLLRYYDDDKETWLLIEQFPKNNETLTRQLKQLL